MSFRARFQRFQAIVHVNEMVRRSHSSSVVSHEHIKRAAPPGPHPCKTCARLHAEPSALRAEALRTPRSPHGKSNFNARHWPQPSLEPFSHLVRVRCMPETRRRRPASRSTGRQVPSSSMPTASDCFSRYSKFRTSSLLKKTTASPNAIPFFVPPNDSAFTPACHVRAAGAPPTLRPRGHWPPCR